MSRPASALSADDTPESLRARQLFGCVVTGGRLAATGPSVVADKVEQWLWSSGAPNKALTEADLCETFAIGRRMARQTARVLQQRGVMAPHRGGKGAGGLRPTAPTAEEAARSLVLAAHGAVTPRAIHEARDLLRPLLSDRQGALSGWLNSTMAQIDKAQSAGPAADVFAPIFGCGRKSQVIADRLLGELAAAPDRGKATHLGSLDAIAERYDTRLEIVIEAVRMLEDHQKVVLQRGRGGGVVGSDGSVSQAARMTNAFLSAHGVSFDACREMLEQINIGMIDLACQRIGERGGERVERALGAMAQARDATEVGLAWYPFQREIALMADSPVLHLLAQCLAGTLLLRRLSSADLPDPQARELFDASRSISLNLKQGRTGQSAREHRRCQTALGVCW
ncbi:MULTISPECIES: hypothetical protein [unclassified Novosphingobium]|uniref:hypothetical protein n=1 Tax=unclassified Novosphingobium TaxID=2644732 RepID=UPI000869C81A|nr:MULTISPECIES: hypothetical protein [unclassified Novosphingobium]MBN9143661.1 hypothetical protein [Novosphingobium sp.]MDR6706914.1 DNA-binding FadR family transcriptional regulator [Novosphingobium sp. 1748]ODU83594.1 MAG: hypothetical protein ABT10_04790 [Novosphingobium sp. SCN 63-17]